MFVNRAFFMVDRSWGWVISLFFLFILLSSCAISPEPTMADASVKPSVKPTSDEKLGWWYVQFRLRWPDSKEAIWYPDLLLADRVIAVSYTHLDVYKRQRQCSGRNASGNR